MSFSSHPSNGYGDSLGMRPSEVIHRNQRRASLQYLAKMENVARKNKQEDKDALFTSINETQWTVADHHKLYAIDRLQTRIMEFHNNVHRRERFAAAHDDHVKIDDVVAFLMTCTASQSDSVFQPIEKRGLFGMSKKIGSYVKSTPSSGAQWVHMMDLSALPTIAHELKLDPLIKEHFGDLRFHSMMIPTVGGCCMSLCYFQMNQYTLSVSMYKLYFYVTNGFILTFVAELMPDVDFVQSSESGIAEQTLQSMTEMTAMEDMPVAIDAVFNAVVDRWEEMTARAAQLGPMYVFYELAAEALAAQDSLLEFLSRSIFHFKKKTSFRLSYRKKLQLVKRLLIVSTAINVVESSTSYAADMLDGLAKVVSERNMSYLGSSDINTANAKADILTMDALIPATVLGARQLPLIYDLSNSYRFAHACLNNEAKEVKILSESIDSISQMRADNTALVLSLIATIFLPATFLTGVFGMNFQEHGGYTIEIVNSKWGPLVFYCLCFALALSLVVYYVRMGWIEAFAPVRAVLNLLVGKKGMMRILGSDFEEDVNDEPESRRTKMVSVPDKSDPVATLDLRDLSSGNEDARPSISVDGARGRKSGPSSGDMTPRVVSTGGAVRSPFFDSSALNQLEKNNNNTNANTNTNVLVPKRVAEALEEEARRQEESRRRRTLAQLQGVQPSTAGPSSGSGAIMRGSLLSSYSRPTLSHRSRYGSRVSSQAGSESDSVK